MSAFIEHGTLRFLGRAIGDVFVTNNDFFKLVLKSGHLLVTLSILDCKSAAALSAAVWSADEVVW